MDYRNYYHPTDENKYASIEDTRWGHNLIVFDRGPYGDAHNVLVEVSILPDSRNFQLWKFIWVDDIIIIIFRNKRNDQLFKVDLSRHWDRIEISMSSLGERICIKDDMVAYQRYRYTYSENPVYRLHLPSLAEEPEITEEEATRLGIVMRDDPEYS